MADIDSVRKTHLAVAEMVDAWRMIPRALVAGYATMMWVVVKWYMNIQPTIIQGCDLEKLGEICISQGPTTQHAALVTAVVGVAAAVFGLYSSTGKSWNEKFISWKEPKDESKSDI